MPWSQATYPRFRLRNSVKFLSQGCQGTWCYKRKGFCPIHSCLLKVPENASTEDDRAISSNLISSFGTQQDWADGVVGFFGSSFRKTFHKSAFRRKQLEEGFDPILLETVNENIPGYGYCAESTLLLSNLAMWVHLFLGKFIFSSTCSLTDEYRQKDSKPKFTSAIEGVLWMLKKLPVCRP